MAEQKRGKLNQLERLLPEGLLADATWMSGHGYSTSLRSQYVAAGWLQHPLRQVYRRSRSPLTWQQAVVSLQTFLGYNLVVGGRSALQLQGFAHYFPLTEMRKVYLYGPKHPPAWVDKLPLETEFLYRNSHALFRNPAGIVNTGLATPFTPEFGLPNDGQGKIASHQQWEGRPLIHSSPERALLELLDELPKGDSFHEVDMAIEGLTNLSPNRLENLLLDCRSVKVKRLFFFFADRHQHGWLKHINKNLVNLGKGKRMLVRGGTFNAAYQITVPEDLDGLR
jgi:hypothetical protein